MSSDVRVWCLRHAESSNVLAGAAGALPEATLTPAGRAQATGAVPVLAGHSPTRVYTSTAVRAVSTAEIIAEGLRLDQPTPLAELVEVGIGCSEGSLAPATRTETARVLHAWVVRGRLGTRVADGETGHHVVRRMSSALRIVAEQNPDGTVALVGHVASLTAGLSALCGLGAEIWGCPLPHAAPFLVERRQEVWRCVHWPRSVGQ